jgi:hypothetical protein
MAAGNYLPLYQGEIIKHRWSMLAKRFVGPIGPRLAAIKLQVMATGIAEINTIVMYRTGIQLVLVL